MFLKPGHEKIRTARSVNANLRDEYRQKRLVKEAVKIDRFGRIVFSK